MLMDALGLSAFLSSFQASQWMLEDFNQKLFSYRHIMIMSMTQVIHAVAENFSC